MLDAATKEFFEQRLIEFSGPLAKSVDITAILKKIDEQGEVIKNLQSTIAKKDEQIVIMEHEIKRMSHNQAILFRKIDDLEQYGRRYSVRINGVEVKPDGQREDVTKLVEECCAEMDTPFQPTKIDRAHRVGGVVTDTRSKKKTQPIIVKFRSWDARTAFYKARPKWKPGGSHRRFSVAPDLTKARYSLLKTAREKIADYAEVSFAFVDLNCRLAIRMTDESVHYFNSVEELDNHLDRLVTTE